MYIFIKVVNFLHYEMTYLQSNVVKKKHLFHLYAETLYLSVTW